MRYYEVRMPLRPRELAGISEEQIAQHWQLYEGYVRNVNALRAELTTLRSDGKGAMALYADRRRRLAFEYDGMVLHELYFENLHAGVPRPDHNTPLRMDLEREFGSVDAFVEDFAAAGASRSVGWAILALDPVARVLNTLFVEVHEHGHVAGFVPLLVMDVWEHAYMVDHGAGGRAAYVKVFLDNADWRVVARRFADAIWLSPARQWC